MHDGTRGFCHDGRRTSVYNKKKKYCFGGAPIDPAGCHDLRFAIIVLVHGRIIIITKKIYMLT